MGFQQSLLATKDENDNALKLHNEQMTFLPVSNLQERFEGTPELSDLELEILNHTITGVEIKGLGSEIFRTIACVKWRLSHIYWKFNVKNRLQLINKASKGGLHFVTQRGIPQSFSLNVDMLAHMKKEK
jgi:DNA-binding NarL/FixJ family response regulator